jgi:hypothetical protein
MTQTRQKGEAMAQVTRVERLAHRFTLTTTGRSSSIRMDFFGL